MSIYYSLGLLTTSTQQFQKTLADATSRYTSPDEQALLLQLELLWVRACARAELPAAYVPS